MAEPVAVRATDFTFHYFGNQRVQSIRPLKDSGTLRSELWNYEGLDLR
jgi:hypothetical protein